jgi:hypothetical protein
MNDIEWIGSQGEFFMQASSSGITNTQGSDEMYAESGMTKGTSLTT